MKHSQILHIEYMFILFKLFPSPFLTSCPDLYSRMCMGALATLDIHIEHNSHHDADKEGQSCNTQADKGHFHESLFEG